MSETDMTVIKPTMMKPHIWLQTSDGSIQYVEVEIAWNFPLIREELRKKNCKGYSKNSAICLPQQIKAEPLSLIFDYYRFHLAPGRSKEERKLYNENFNRMELWELYNLVMAADNLQLTSFVNFVCRAATQVIEGKTSEEIREIFQLPNEKKDKKLQSLKNTRGNPRIRLLNLLVAKKRKQLKERKKSKNVEVEEKHADERSVEELLSFINGNDGASKGTKASKNKKKNRRKNEQKKNSSMKEAYKPNQKEANSEDIKHQSDEATEVAQTSNSHTKDDTFSHEENDEGDTEDDFDPALKEKIDREVEDFARRLNFNWLEWMQEFLSSKE